MAENPGNGQPDKGARLDAYQKKVRALKDRSALREVLEREVLLELLKLNSGVVNEYPMLETQQTTVARLLTARAGHPAYEFIHQRVANFIVLLAHYGKAVKVGDKKRAAELEGTLLNAEAVLVKCTQGIVFALALTTDNYEEVLLRYFGKQGLSEYSALIEKHEVDQQFWSALFEHFIANKVVEAHREILDGNKYTITKERSFLVIRFLFDDILAKLNPTSAEIDKTRIQTLFMEGRESEEGIRKTKIIQATLKKGVSPLSTYEDIDPAELLQASRIATIDTLAGEYVAEYEKRLAGPQTGDEKPDRETEKKEQARYEFLKEQTVALGIGAAIALGVVSGEKYKAIEESIGSQIKGILPFKGDYSVAVLEKILFFLLESHTQYLLRETGRDEGGKIQIRSGRARRVPLDVVDALPNMSKIRKKQLFGNDVTRENTLLFKPKTAKQMVETMAMLSLEDELREALTALWKKAVFRVDIMVLINLELVAKTTTNLAARLGEILSKYEVSLSNNNL